MTKEVLPMFFSRSDGRRIRSLPAMQKIMPYIMRTRTGSVNFFREALDCAPLEAYIAAHNGADAQSRLGVMHILIAALVRTIALRPQLNRFVVHSRIYARRGISVSFVVHRSLRVEDGGTTIKLEFTGTEDLPTIARAVNAAVLRETAPAAARNATDSLADGFMRLPDLLIRPLIGFVMRLDHWNLLPEAVLKASPFHTTVFLTNLKSLGIDSIFHHLYEFGTNGIFMAMGKEALHTVSRPDGSTAARREIHLDFALDGRFCDGLYFARSMRLFRKFLRDPALLETRLERTEEDLP